MLRAFLATVVKNDKFLVYWFNNFKNCFSFNPNLSGFLEIKLSSIVCKYLLFGCCFNAYDNKPSALVGIIYAYVAIEQFIQGNIPMFIVWVGDAFANLGLWMAVR